MSWACYVLDFLHLMPTIMTVTLPLPEQLHGCIDLSTLHSVRQKKVLNNPRWLEGIVLYYFVVVLMMWSTFCVSRCLPSRGPPHILARFSTVLFIYFFICRLPKIQRKTHCACRRLLYNWIVDILLIVSRNGWIIYVFKSAHLFFLFFFFLLFFLFFKKIFHL